MNESQNLGQKGESLAAAFLEEKGYWIRHRNWKAGKNEIDIIAENHDYVIFTEVKTRTAEYLGELRDLVSSEKQRIITYVAGSYLKRFEITKEGRFDIIIVVAEGDRLEIKQHIEHAFYPALK